MKAQVSLDTAFYILENIKNIEEMEMEIVEYPSYLSGDLRDKKIDEIIEEFLENNPYSKSEVLQ
ncbi:MAG: hypothetical protein LBU27_08105 [Candidatus Peribacteria bacterium]|nr:hypothetical protein [Candidatus Peribacteria bacterium]